MGITLTLFAVLCFGGDSTPTGAVEIDSDAENASPGGAGSNLAAGTAVIKLGDRSWTFTTSEGMRVMCRTNMMGNKGGITAIGNEIGSDGAPLRGATRLEMTVYPEDWTPSGTQSHSIKIIGPGKEDNWSTATPTRIKKNPGIRDLTRAVVHSWSLRGSWASGTATFYLKDSLLKAQAGGELVLSDGSFEILCSK